MSYYKIINGIRYDRALLDQADQFTRGRGESRISLEEIQTLYKNASDRGAVTPAEWRTLLYISQNYTLTDVAKSWIRERLDEPDDLKDFEKNMQRVVRDEFGFSGLHWKILPEEVQKQAAKPANTADFFTALRSALNAFIHRGINQLCLQAVVRRRVSGDETEEENRKNVRDYMNGGGILFLVPDSGKDFEFDLPDDAQTENFWKIGLHIPAFSPVLFMASVARNDPNFYHSQGYISRRPSIDDLVFSVVRQLTQFTRLKWEIPTEEVHKQLNIIPIQNFGEALFAALNVGIFNGESSFSFRDFIRAEIWNDPERPLDDYMREYIETGVLKLLSPETGTSDFDIPENLAPDFKFSWVFGLEMPKKTDVRFVITAWREPDIEASWCDGFLPEKLSIENQIRRVIELEFGLPALKVIVPEGEYEVQRTKFGPDYRDVASLLRQTLNTLLHDYITRDSLFRFVGEIHREEVDPTQFDDPFEYRNAIKFLIIKYLKKGELEFLSADTPENSPPNGETAELFWRFSGRFPELGDIGFWILIPRFPDDGQLPYCYGVN